MSDNFRAVFCGVARMERSHESPIARAAIAQACATDTLSHPLMWRVLEDRIGHRYHRLSHQPQPTEGFDWHAIWQWLVDHWPEIVGLILSIIMLFL